MPIPTPRKNEKKSKYMTRCVSFLTQEGKPSNQAVAICSQKWSERNKDVLSFLIDLKMKGLI